MPLKQDRQPLPLEIAGVIIGYVSKEEDYETLRNMSPVYRGWCDLARSPLFAMFTVRPEWDHSSLAARVEYLSTHPHLASMIKNLRIGWHQVGSKNTVLDLITATPNVDSLFVVGDWNDEASDQVMMSLVMGFKQLRNLTIIIRRAFPSPHIRDSALVHPMYECRRPSLTSLAVQGSANILTSILMSLLDYPSRSTLTSIFFGADNSYVWYDTYAQEYSALLDACTKFSSVEDLAWYPERPYFNESRLYIHERMDVPLCHFPKLESLRITATLRRNDLDADMRMLKDVQLPSLKDLHISIGQGPTLPFRPSPDDTILNPEMAKQLDTLHLEFLTIAKRPESEVLMQAQVLRSLSRIGDISAEKVVLSSAGVTHTMPPSAR